MVWLAFLLVLLYLAYCLFACSRCSHEFNHSGNMNMMGSVMKILYINAFMV